ncbi:Cytidine deaminase 1 [Linum perenne]
MAKQLGVTTVACLFPSLVKSVQSLARPPISNYHVGVVGLGSTCRIFFGANIEFPGLLLNNSIHAEKFLVTDLDLNAEPSISSSVVSAAPYGHCRQFLQELYSFRSIRILITDNQHGMEFEDLSTVLQHRFGPDDLLAPQGSSGKKAMGQSCFFCSKSWER